MLVTSKDAIRIKVIHDRAVNYMFEEFTCDACKRDRTLVSKVAFVKIFKRGVIIGSFHSSEMTPGSRQSRKSIVKTSTSSDAKFLVVARNLVRAGCFRGIDALEIFENSFCNVGRT